MTGPVPLPEDEIHLWTCRDDSIADPDTLSRFVAMLTPHERERRARFHFERDRHQYLVTRAMLRTVLSLYRPLVAPQAWRFVLDTYGKPRLCETSGPALCFNLSHTHGLIVLAIAQREIGVDVEHLDRGGDLAGLADRYFAPIEQEDLSRLPAAKRQRRFVELWTLKEAYVKARGVGLTQALDTFSFRLGATDPHTLEHRSHDDCPRSWRFWSARLLDGYCLALAARNAPSEPEPIPRICEFTPPRQFVPVRCLSVWQDGFGRRSRSPFLDIMTAEPR